MFLIPLMSPSTSLAADLLSINKFITLTIFSDVDDELFGYIVYWSFENYITHLQFFFISLHQDFHSSTNILLNFSASSDMNSTVNFTFFSLMRDFIVAFLLSYGQDRMGIVWMLNARLLWRLHLFYMWHIYNYIAWLCPPRALVLIGLVNVEYFI